MVYYYPWDIPTTIFALIITVSFVIGLIVIHKKRHTRKGQGTCNEAG